MMRYALCNVSDGVSHGRYIVKVVALFQHREDAEALRFSVPSLNKKIADVVDITTGEILNEPDISVEYFMNMQLTYENARKMHLVCVERRNAVQEYFKGWRKRNGIEEKKEKSA